MKRVGLFVIVIMLFHGSANADDGVARKHYERGLKSYNLQEFKVALEEFKAAYVERTDAVFQTKEFDIPLSPASVPPAVSFTIEVPPPITGTLTVKVDAYDSEAEADREWYWFGRARTWAASGHLDHLVGFGHSAW
jgi:hypothetical protein